MHERGGFEEIALDRKPPQMVEGDQHDLVIRSRDSITVLHYDGRALLRAEDEAAPLTRKKKQKKGPSR